MPAWSHFDLRSLISMILQLLVIGISFLSPQTMRTHRANRSLEKFVATLMTIEGFLQVRLRRNKRWAKQIAHLAVSPLREALIENFPGSFAINQCLRFLRQAVEGHGINDEAAVYCLFSSSALYIGKALLQRAQGKLGLPSRITEHLTSILRTGSAAARSIKGILLRKCPPATLCFLPVKRGRHDWIKASETISH